MKRYAQQHPPRLKAWDPDSKTRVAHMEEGDFYGSEKSAVIGDTQGVRIEFVDPNGSVTVLKEKVELTRGEVIDTSVMNVRKLRQFYSEQIEQSKRSGAAIASFEGDHDEGFRSSTFRPCGFHLLQRIV